MKKRLSHFPYNERSRPGWTPSTSLRKPLSPIRSTMKTVTYVPGTFVTLVPGPYRGDVRGGYLDSSLVAAFAALGSLSLNQQPLQRLDSQKPKWEASLRD